MSSATITLRSLLADTRGSLSLALEASRSDRGRAHVIDHVWQVVQGSVDQDIGRALHQDLIGVLVDGWSRADELAGYADPNRYPATRTVTMSLGHTTSTIEVDPELTLVIGEAVREKLPLKIAFRVTLDSVILTICGGEIRAVGLGKIGLAANLKWGDHETPLALQTPELILPGTRTLDPPVEIPRMHRPNRNDDNRDVR